MGRVIMSGIVPQLTKPSSGILASDLAVGSIVKLMEDGTEVDYLVVNQGIPEESSYYDDSCNGTWLLRKDIKENRQWHSSNVNDYENSTIHGWLNGEFFNSLGAKEQAAIKQVKIPYSKGTGAVASGNEDVHGENGLTAKVFLLGTDEVGWSFSDSEYYFCSDNGAKLSYFESSTTSAANAKRVAYLNGTAAAWWLRYPRRALQGSDATTTSSVIVGDGGSFGSSSATTPKGIRPALILPSNALFDENTIILKGVA